MRLIPIPFRVATGFSHRLDRAVGLGSWIGAVDRDHPRCVTDGGTDRVSRDARGNPDLDALRQSAAPYLFAVDAADQLTTLSEPLSELAAASPGQHLSALLAVPAADIGAHLRTVRQRLRKADTETVRSTGCRLRTADERREVTIEFSTPPIAEESATDRLVGTIRLAAVELGVDQPQAAAGPDRFRELFEQLPDPVAEVRFSGDEPIVTSINPAFEETFGYELAELVDEPLNEHIVPEGVDDATVLDREAASGEWTSAEIIREAADGPRLFLFRGIPFTHDGQQRGFGVYTDVTDKESQQRYHEVLNRLLRHNLRNDLNVILGLADQLTASLETAETESTAVGERLKQRALDLVETTRRARELESVIDRSETETEPIAVDELIADACESLRAEYPHADLDCTVDPSAVAVAGPALREAVVELVENAVEHTAAEPTIHVRVESRPDSGSVVITVADDGPGIPPDERDVIDGSRSITPLEHASGLGLWLAKWIAEAYGGEIAFVGPDRELGGAAVELRVRQADASAADRLPETE
ncbi:sensor histidine kinase [Halohasta litorea]|uniref:histidine kinase n=1 Tax=Halohasta litorea TaxID=869891 RepID=A0ABD6D3I2_9EURY|nr:ATP-binding protein [Halohasta litorea]